MTRDANPLQYAGCYTLDLYCDQQRGAHTFADGSQGAPRMSQYVGRNFHQCAKIARANGWRIHGDRTATCPECRKRSLDE